MRVQSFHASISDACGIAVFSRHLSMTLSEADVEVIEINLRRGMPNRQYSACICHYVPSGFINPEVSDTLKRVLSSISAETRLCVVMHGVHALGETQFAFDAICADQEQHIRLMFERASSIVMLSDGVERAAHSWRQRWGSKARFVRMDHPGLFVPAKTQHAECLYAFLGGISRPKKDHNSESLVRLAENCERSGIRVWQHWTNVKHAEATFNSWRYTEGLVQDRIWADMVSQAKVILCPYRTRIQAVSGIVSEAISSNRFVLATSFDAALEMSRVAPELVWIENDLDAWPEIIQKLPINASTTTTRQIVPTWLEFSNCVASQLFYDWSMARETLVPQGKLKPRLASALILDD